MTNLTRQLVTAHDKLSPNLTSVHHRFKHTRQEKAAYFRFLNEMVRNLPISHVSYRNRQAQYWQGCCNNI